MSVTEREVPFELGEGGFPSLDEFNGVWNALADVDEFGLDRLISRIVKPLVDAYEQDGSRLDWTYAELGLLSERARSLIDLAEMVLRKARQLETIAGDVGEVIRCRGAADCSPTYGKLGGEYVPSREAMERWGLAKPKGGESAR